MPTLTNKLYRFPPSDCLRIFCSFFIEKQKLYLPFPTILFSSVEEEHSNSLNSKSLICYFLSATMKYLQKIALTSIASYYILRAFCKTFKNCCFLCRTSHSKFCDLANNSIVIFLPISKAVFFILWIY